MVKNDRTANAADEATLAEEGVSVGLLSRWKNEDEYYDDDDDGRWRRVAKIAAGSIVAVVLAVAGVAVLRRAGESTDAGGAAISGPTTSLGSEPPSDSFDPTAFDPTSRPTSDSDAADATDGDA